MVVLVCGGRDFKDHDATYDFLDEFHAKHTITHVIHGGATGADTFGGFWATMKGIPQSIYYPQWKKHGRAAGILRNQQMLDNNPGIDFVIAFPGGRGTADMISRANKKGIPVVVVDPKTK